MTHLLIEFIIYDEFQKVIDEYPLPKDMYLVTTTHNNAYFSLNGKIITEKSLTYYLSKKENPKEEFLRIRNKFKVAIPYLQFRFADIVEKNMENDIIASIINERLNQNLTIDDLAQKAEIVNIKTILKQRILTQLTYYKKHALYYMDNRKIEIIPIHNLPYYLEHQSLTIWFQKDFQ